MKLEWLAWVVSFCMVTMCAVPVSAKKIRKGETVTTDEVAVRSNTVSWSRSTETVSLVAKGIGVGDAVRLLPCAVQFENVGDLDAVKISANLRGVTLRQALDAICSQAGFGYEVVNDNLVKIYQFKHLSYTLPVTPVSEDYTASMTGGNQLSGGAQSGGGGPGSPVMGGGGSNGPSSNGVSTSGDLTLRHTSKVDLWSTIQTNLGHLTAQKGVVTVDPRSSMVFVRCPAAYVSSVEAYMQRLMDALLLSLEIEICIVDVTYNNDTAFGIDWDVLLKNLSFDKGLQIFSGGPGSFVLSSALGTDPFSFGLKRSKDGRQEAILKALLKFGTIRVVEKTNMHLRNNTAATLRRGENIPYIDSITQTAMENAVQTAVQKGNVLSGVDIAVMASVYKDMVSIAITPRVTQLLNIEEIEAGGTKIQNPRTRVRENLIQVLLGDGQTAVVAGVKSSKTGQDGIGIPGLSNLPVIGPLFGFRENLDNGGQIVMMITPRIVRAQPRQM